MGNIAHPSESIWIPGAGELRLDELAVARAVEEYDSDLTLGQDRRSGQWAVFLPTSDGLSQFPVLGLGHELPSVDRVKEILHRHDMRRNGRAILAEMEAHQERADKEFSDKVDEAAQEVAEAIASHMQSEGTHPFPQVYMGGKRAAGKVRSS
jgi:hypothetical protein